MAHNLTEADTYTAAVQVPDDGDTASAASVEAGFQDLADRTNYLKLRMESLAYDTWGDADKTITVGTEWHQTAAATAARTVTLRHSTAPIPKAGQRMRAVGWGAGANTVTFQREDTTAIAILAADQRAVEFVYTGAAWVVSWVEEPANSATPWSSVVRV